MNLQCCHELVDPDVGVGVGDRSRDEPGADAVGRVDGLKSRDATFAITREAEQRGIRCGRQREGWGLGRTWERVEVGERAHTMKPRGPYARGTRFVDDGDVRSAEHEREVRRELEVPADAGRSGREGPREDGSAMLLEPDDHRERDVASHVVDARRDGRVLPNTPQRKATRRPAHLIPPRPGPVAAECDRTVWSDALPLTLRTAAA